MHLHIQERTRKKKEKIVNIYVYILPIRSDEVVHDEETLIIKAEARKRITSMSNTLEIEIVRKDCSEVLHTTAVSQHYLLNQ